MDSHREIPPVPAPVGWTFVMRVRLYARHRACSAVYGTSGKAPDLTLIGPRGDDAPTSP